MTFNIDLRDVDYSNNVEYRKVLATLCNLQSSDVELPEDILEEYMDDVFFDSDNMERAIAFVYDKTKHHVLFQELYRLAAAMMMTEEPTIGLMILFSYDYLKCFYPCIYTFLHQPDQFHEETDCYKTMMHQFSK